MDHDQIYSILQKNIMEIHKEPVNKKISESADLKEYCNDPLEIAEVISRSMKQLKIKVPRVELTKAKNIGELIAIFKKYKDKT